MTYMYETPDPSIHGVLLPELDEDLEFDFGVFFMDGESNKPPQELRQRPDLPVCTDYGFGIVMIGKIPRGRDERNDPPCEAQREMDEQAFKLGRPILTRRKPLIPMYQEYWKDNMDNEEEEELSSNYLLSRAPGRQVHLTCHRKRWVIYKEGRYVSSNETTALHYASERGLPVPQVFCREKLFAAANGDMDRYSIKMSYLPGQTLTKSWNTLTHEERIEVATQVRNLLLKLSVPDESSGLIGNCDGEEIRDSHVTHTHFGPICKNERDFNRYLVSTISDAPAPIRRDYARRLNQKKHRIVFCHCDLSPDNILVDYRMKVVGLLDWEDAGYYPEHWESIKFYSRPEMVPGWHDIGRYILPNPCEEEVQDFMEVRKYQLP